MNQAIPHELIVSSLLLMAWVTLQAVLWTKGALKLESTRSKIEETSW